MPGLRKQKSSLRQSQVASSFLSKANSDELRKPDTRPRRRDIKRRPSGPPEGSRASESEIAPAVRSSLPCLRSGQVPASVELLALFKSLDPTRVNHHAEVFPRRGALRLRSARPQLLR